MVPGSHPNPALSGREDLIPDTEGPGAVEAAAGPPRTRANPRR